MSIVTKTATKLLTDDCEVQLVHPNKTSTRFCNEVQQRQKIALGEKKHSAESWSFIVMALAEIDENIGRSDDKFRLSVAEKFWSKQLSRVELRFLVVFLFETQELKCFYLQFWLSDRFENSKNSRASGHIRKSGSLETLW